MTERSFGTRHIYSSFGSADGVRKTEALSTMAISTIEEAMAMEYVKLNNGVIMPL